LVEVGEQALDRVGLGRVAGIGLGAILMPAPAKARAIEALRPAPAPTISASWFSFAMMTPP
jgi:hypothetical protein